MGFFLSIKLFGKYFLRSLHQNFQPLSFVSHTNINSHTFCLENPCPKFGPNPTTAPESSASNHVDKASCHAVPHGHPKSRSVRVFLTNLIVEMHGRKLRKPLVSPACEATERERAEGELKFCRWRKGINSGLTSAVKIHTLN